MSEIWQSDGELFIITLKRVRSIGREGSYSDDYSVSFFSTLYNTLMLLSGVTRLRFSILEYVPDSYHTGLQFCFFPNLRELRLEMQVSTPVLNFVYRNHRSLKELAFNSPPFDCDDDFPRPINAFPELVNFSGRCTLIPLIVPGAPLQDICTDIYSTEDADSMEDMEYALCELQRAGAPVDTFDILSDYWSYEFFAYLSEYVPNVQIIQYRTRDLDGYDSIVSWELLSVSITLWHMFMVINKPLMHILRSSLQSSHRL